MLTVKHIRQDGSEELYTCGSVRYIPDDGSVGSFGNAGLYLDPEPEKPAQSTSESAAQIIPPNGFLSRMAIPVSRCASSTDRCRPEAFVMNANGATVARYVM